MNVINREPTEPAMERSLIAGSPRTRSVLVAPMSIARWLLVFMLLAGVYFFHGFLVPALAAMIIGFVSWPLYRRLLGSIGGSRTLGATIAILLVIFFIIAPLSATAFYAFRELKVWAAWAIQANAQGAPVPVWVSRIPILGDPIADEWVRYFGHPGGLGELVQAVSGSNIGNIYKGIVIVGATAFQWVLTLLFMLITLFFVYRNGEELVAQLDIVGESVLPNRWERVSRIVPLTISSTVIGMTVIAIGEGIVLGTAYWLAGVPSPVTLGLITGVMALIPGGAPLCFTLVSVYLGASGHWVEGVALLAWGSIELFVVDKTLRPKLVGGPIKLPFLPTFFGLIGGVKTMGFLGLFVGPVLMALLVATWREWLHEVKIHAESTTASHVGARRDPQPVLDNHKVAAGE
jgi:predicted PurR-regulated permease PerM